MLGDILNFVEVCPYCKKHIHPEQIDERRENDDVIFIYKCPSCKELIIIKVKVKVKNGAVSYTLTGMIPYDISEMEFSKEIKQISEKFCIIYNQSRIAEQLNLTEICGGGYRKALEFLVKDYAILKNKEEEEKIKKKSLKACIDDIKDPKINACADRARFIGNDEVHYIRKIENQDIEVLKDLINLTVSWIELEFKTERIFNN